MRTPTAVRPATEAVAPFSSSTFTTNTVLEKLNANAISSDLGKADTGDQRGSHERQEIDSGREAHDGHRHVQPRDGPHLRAREGTKVELEPDREQQQGDADIRQSLQHFPARYSIHVEREPGCQEPHHGRQPDGPGQQAQDEGQGDPGDVSQGGGDQLEVHGASGGRAWGTARTSKVQVRPTGAQKMCRAARLRRPGALGFRNSQIGARLRPDPPRPAGVLDAAPPPPPSLGGSNVWGAPVSLPSPGWATLSSHS